MLNKRAAFLIYEYIRKRKMAANIIIAVLQVLFVSMSFTVEQEYCQGPLDPTSTTLFVKDTVDFSIAYNPLFHERPRWLVEATCIHAYGFWILYSTIFYLAITDGWSRPSLLTRVLVPIGIGAKLNAVVFYHYMEFTSHTPPTHLVPYFSAEGGYLVSLGLVIYKLASAASSDSKRRKLD
mmetsp:Transcript_1727/g.3643  ORF Transcript_1727/g.3643 Transcript_1727/m.3643 type:complete len:180 (-) Transcript_1727:145-684(-)